MSIDLIIAYFCVPIFILIAGGWMFFFPPKDINAMMGYRTKRSMKNQENWDFAQRYSGKVWLIGGSIMLIGTMMIAFFPLDFENPVTMFTIMGIQLVFTFSPIYFVETSLKNK